MIESTVVNRLLRWKRWKMRSGVALGYPSQSPFCRLAPSATHYSDPGIDDECVTTNDAVNMLPEVYKLVIRLEYIEDLLSEDQRVHCYGKSRRTYREDRTRAYLLIGNALDMLISNRLEEVA